MTPIEKLSRIVEITDAEENAELFEFIRERADMEVGKIVSAQDAALQEKGFLRGLRWVLSLSQTLKEEIKKKSS